MITPGGEAAFVTRMIEESLELRAKIQWFTSMLGKLSSVTTLVEALMERDNHNYAVTEFVQGNKTKRWAVAWSWGDMRPSMVFPPLHIHSFIIGTDSNIKLKRPLHEESQVSQNTYFRSPPITHSLFHQPPMIL